MQGRQTSETVRDPKPAPEAVRIPDTPDVRPSYLHGRPEDSAWDLLAAGGDRRFRYGYGKAALRDGLAAVGCGPGSNVVLPAYVPAGVVEPIRELRAEPRFYGIDRDLAPRESDLRAAVDDDTAAVLAVDYFGFPQAGFEAIEAVAREHEAAVVDDDAHGPLSRHEGEPLGTRGDLGFTSLRKGFPVPDGAILYLDDRVAASLDPSPFAGRRRFPTSRDAGFVAASLGAYAGRRAPAFGRLLEAVTAAESRDDGDATTATSVDRDSPRRQYERAKRPMSRLSEHVVARIPAGEVVAARRRAYRGWVEELRGVDPVFDRLPEAVCPKVCPVVASEPRPVVEGLEATGVEGVHSWPPLPREVAAADDYGTARWLADHLLALPVHRDVPVDRIPAVAAEIR